MPAIFNTTEQTLQDIRNYLRTGFLGTQCVGFQQLSVGATVLMLTVPDNATSCRIDCTNAGVATGDVCRYRLDGVDPTTSIGGFLGHYDTLDIPNNQNMRSARFIATSGTTLLNVTYYA